MSTEQHSGAAVDNDANLRWEDCLATAIRYFHDLIDQPIQDHTEQGGHPERATTAREYFHKRGWSDETIDSHLLGWSPPMSKNSLEAHLAVQGYTKEELLATGLFTDELKPLWHGRYVFPYFNRDGQPAYAISRCTGGKGGGKIGYDGNPSDFMSGKYGRLAHTKEYVRVTEPIFGKETVCDDEPLIITEGIADAITIQEAGYACVSPVTTQFSRDNQVALLALLEAHTVSGVYVLQDAERPSVDYDQNSDKLNTEQFGPGVKGAVKTSSLLTENGLEAYVNTPPRLGLRKVDVDDYLQEGWGSLDALLRGAKPPSQHPAYTPQDQSDQSPPPSLKQGSPQQEAAGETSNLFNLNITDVTGLSQDFRGMNPLGHKGDSENYFVVTDVQWAYDHKRSASYNALTYLLCDAGERPVDNPNGSLSEKETFVAWKHAKQNGLLSENDPIPQDGLIHIAFEHGLCEPGDIHDGRKLPIEAYNTALGVVREEYGLDPGRDPYDSSGQGDNPRQSETLRHSPIVLDEQPDTPNITLDEAQNRCQKAIRRALAQSQHSLIDALPAQGKSRGVVEWAAENDTPLTVFAPRRELLNNEYAEWCDELGLSYYMAPAFPRDCTCALGEHGDGWKNRVFQLYNSGVTPGEIHGLAKAKFGEEPPCQREGNCPYISKRDFDPSSYDVLLGHYSHAYQEDLVDDRVVVIDETPTSAFIEGFQHAEVESIVSNYLQQQDDITFENYGELTSSRESRYRVGDARKWFQENEPEVHRDGVPVMLDDSDRTNAFAPVLTYALLTADDLGNGWQRATLPEGRVAVRNCNPSEKHDENELFILNPPSLDEAKHVIGLDGTPWQRQWELCLGASLTNYSVLDYNERQAYLQEALDLTIVQIGDAAKSYSSGKWVKPRDDSVLLEYVGKEERRLPDVISSKRALQQYDEANMSDLIGKREYYGNLKGSNKFEHSRVGVVIGSPHYGDTYVKKWGALADEAVQRLSDNGGMDLDYGELGNEILHDMRESEVLQALMRFGRDGDSTMVYVFTAALPEWVPVAHTGEIWEWCGGMLQVLDHLGDRDWNEWRTSDLVTNDTEKPVLSTNDSDAISERQVRRHLSTLCDLDFLDQRTEGCGTVWEDAGLDNTNDTREVVFPE
jgi:hypothetical protein